jgi:hypothetical protein
LAALKQCEVAQFACHGIANFDDPSSSRLELSDGDLSVRDFLEMRRTNSRLALLSACKSGLIGMQLPSRRLERKPCTVTRSIFMRRSILYMAMFDSGLPGF